VTGRSVKKGTEDGKNYSVIIASRDVREAKWPLDDDSTADNVDSPID
jgi:hypothetical protein